jgi:DNA-binding transcriptional MocR family regulator
MTARPNDTNSTPNSRTATRVTGSETLKHTTPTNPSSSPRASFLDAIALSEVATHNDIAHAPDDATTLVDAYLRGRCAKGRAGDRLPAVRALQERFHVSPITVQRVVRKLVMEGLAVTRPGDGTFIGRESSAAPPPIDHTWQMVVLGRSTPVPGGLDHLAAAPDAAMLSLDNAFPDAGLQAQELLAKATIRVARRSDAWDRCDPQGTAKLREIFANEVGRPFTADNVLVTPGAQAALDSIFRTLARPGDAVVLENPCYPGAIVAATLSGLTPAPVPTDEHGVLPDALAAVIARTGARLVVLQPRHANPTGSILSADRRSEVLGIAREFGCFVVEDDWVRDLDLDGPTGPPMLLDDEHGHVIYLRSLSKSAAPGLRLAALIARGPALKRLTSARLAADFFVAPLLQAAAADVLESTAWQRHLVAMRSELAHRRDALLAALTAHAPALSCRAPGGGVALWVGLPAGVTDIALVQACAERGVRIAPGRNFFLAEPTQSFVRLAYASADAKALATAASRIGAALNDLP